MVYESVGLDGTHIISAPPVLSKCTMGFTLNFTVTDDHSFCDIVADTLERIAPMVRDGRLSSSNYGDAKVRGVGVSYTADIVPVEPARGPK